MAACRFRASSSCWSGCKAEGFGLGVCTNKLEGLSVQLLDALDLSKYFGSVVGPDTLGVAKPDPRPFREAVSRLGLVAPRAVMVGDSETDILTARNAGVPVIGVPFGYTPRPVAGIRAGPHDRAFRRGL